MNAKDILAKMAKKLQGGFVRFAPFNVLALTWALCLVGDNHAAWDDAEAHSNAWTVFGQTFLSAMLVVQLDAKQTIAPKDGVVL